MLVLIAGNEIFVFLLAFLFGEDLHWVLTPCRWCISVSDPDIKDCSDAAFPEVLDSNIASERDSTWGECHTSEVAPFGRDIIVTQCEKATALAGQGVFDGEPLVTPIASQRQVLGVETHAKA